MNKTPHDNSVESMDAERGTLKSYITGFLLSLIFTFIPYYLVVNQKLNGGVLLSTILGFAVLQMIIQVTFFLHLGRGPKPKWNLFFFISTVGIILIIIGGSIMIIDNLHYNMSPSDQIAKLANNEGIHKIGGNETGACVGQNTNHRVVIKNYEVYPAVTFAQKCDTITFINEDKVLREIAFGLHPNHEVYAGEKELILRSGRSKTLSLSETGPYKFHDHLSPKTNGEFIVVPKD